MVSNANVRIEHPWVRRRQLLTYLRNNQRRLSLQQIADVLDQIRDIETKEAQYESLSQLCYKTGTKP